MITCIHSSDVFLRATDGDETTSEQMESGPTEEKQHVEVVESKEESSPEVKINPEEDGSAAGDEEQSADSNAAQDPEGLDTEHMIILLYR